MLKQKTLNILLSRDEGRCAAAVRGVRKFTELPTLPFTMRKPISLCVPGGRNFGPMMASILELKQDIKKKLYFLVKMTQHNQLTIDIMSVMSQ